MLYENHKGRIIHPEEVEEMSPWEIEEQGIHVHETTV